MGRSAHDYYNWIADNLYTAVVGDVLDSLGYRNQVMRYDIRPLYNDAKVVGRAATMQTVSTDRIPDEPYKLELALLDDLKPGEVVVCACQGQRASRGSGESCSARRHAPGKVGGR